MVLDGYTYLPAAEHRVDGVSRREGDIKWKSKSAVLSTYVPPREIISKVWADF